MLEEYKHIYEQKAASIDNYATISTTILCNKYIEYKPINKDLAEAYLSAIVIRYWPLLSKYYANNYLVASPEDCYNWLITSILYALDKHKWLDPENKLFEDKNGPDKVIRKVMQSERLTFYQAINRRKRKINYLIQSLEELKEDFGDAVIEDESYVEDNLDFVWKDYVVNIFNKKDYFLAFFIDAIVNIDCLDENSLIDKQRVAKHFRNMTSDYLKIFSQFYDIPLPQVEKGYQYFSNYSSYKIYFQIDRCLNILRKDSKFIKLMRG